MSMLDFSFLKSKRNFKYLAIVVIILTLDLFFILMPQVRFLIKSVPVGINLNRKIAGINKDIAAGADLLKEYEGLKIGAQSRQNKIVPEAQSALFFSEISGLAKDSRVKLMQIKPGKIGKEEARDAEGRSYYKMPIELELECAYHSLGIFVNKLESSVRYVRLLNLEINSVNEAPFEYPVRMTIEIAVMRGK